MLRLHHPHHGALTTGEKHRYSLDLETGEAVLVEIDQEELDLQATIFDPSSQRIVLFDSYAGQSAPERVCFVAHDSGLHTVELTPVTESSGDYTVQLMQLRPATAADYSCHQATKVFTAAEERRSAKPISEGLAAEYERAHHLWLNADEPLHAALALREAGYLSLNLGLGAEASIRYQRALDLARTVEGATFLEISLLNRLGLALLDQGDLTRAGDVLKEALSLARKTDDQAGEASALNNLANVDQAGGETHLAISRFRQALKIWRELGRAQSLAQTQMSLAEAYALLDNHQEAVNLLADAQAVFRRLGHFAWLADALVSNGWVYYLQGRSEDAIPSLNEAIRLYRQVGRRDGESAALDRLGTALRATGDFNGALAAYRRTFTISEKTDNPKDAANTIANIGCLYEEWGRSLQAREYLEDAYARFQTLDDPKGLSHVEYCRALVESSEGDLSAAIVHIETALDIVDRLRTTARRRGARYRPIWLWQDYSELQLELLMARFRETADQRFAIQAFEASDLARARNLVELVLESQVDVRNTASRQLLAREAFIQERINATQAERQQLQVMGTAAREFASRERHLRELSIQLEEARAAIRAATPNFADIAKPMPVRLTEIQALLEPQTVLLSYTLGAERSYLFTIGHDSFKSWTLESRSSLEVHAKALYESLRRRRFNVLQYSLTARRLGNMLMPPAAIPTNTRRLLVIADGYLHYLPLIVLPSPKDGIESTPESVLLDDFEIQYLPSAAVFAALKRRAVGRPSPSLKVAVFADAVFSNSDPRIGNPSASMPATRPDTSTQGLRPAGASLAARLLPRLPHTHTEAEFILSLVPKQHGLGLFGFDATKQQLFSGGLDRFSIVHIATHAFIDERLPGLSGLVLSRRDPLGRPVDGELHLHEIYGLRLAADLVILSGCQTALGRQVRGDGLVSLSRGFFYAGSSQLLVSLWRVNDEATAALMIELYRGMLGRGETPAAALRSAQLWMRRQEQWNAPYFWAGFVLQGADNKGTATSASRGLAGVQPLDLDT